MVQLLPGKDAVAAGDLDLAREALVAELGAAREVGLAALLDLGALELREAVVEDVALAVVALVRARLGEELVAPLPLREALGLALGEDVRAAEREENTAQIALASIKARPPTHKLEGPKLETLLTLVFTAL